MIVRNFITGKRVLNLTPEPGVTIQLCRGFYSSPFPLFFKLPIFPT